MPSWSVTLREAERGRGYHGSTAGDRPRVVQAPGLSTHQGSSEHFPQDPQDLQLLPILTISEARLPLPTARPCGSCWASPSRDP